MKDYIPIIIIGSISFIGMICILIDMIIDSSSDEDKIIIKTAKTSKEKQLKKTQIDYDDDLIINE